MYFGRFRFLRNPTKDNPREESQATAVQETGKNMSQLGIEKPFRFSSWRLTVLAMQVWEGKPIDEKKEVSDVVVDVKTPKPVEASDDLVKEETKISENGSVTTTTKPMTTTTTTASEKRSGVANGY